MHMMATIENKTISYKSCKIEAKTKKPGQMLFEISRSEKHGFFYFPHFCVAEAHSVFMKYTFGRWIYLWENKDL